MKKLHLTICIQLLLANILFAAQPFASWNKSFLTLTNGLVERIIQLPADTGKFVTLSYKPVGGSFGYFQKTNEDFQFEWNDRVYSGRSGWQLKNIQTVADENGGNGATVTLISNDKKFELTVRYLLYPGNPVIRKNLSFKNLGGETAKLQSVDVEKFELASMTFTWIMSDYGRRKSLGPFLGGRQDALVGLHNINSQQGIIIGNEAPGVLKRTSVLWDASDICAGLTHKDDVYPFRKWINARDSFETTKVFTIVYSHQQTPDSIMNRTLPDFIRKYMGIRLSKLDHKPTFVYNTWVPFKKNINEKLVMELAKAAAAAGMKEFVIDDGWQDGYGDWGIDSIKFPHGLTPVFDYIKSLGMKPGLWLSIGSASPTSQVFKTHPEWFVKNKTDNFTSLHVVDEKDKYTACFSTGWYDYIKKILLQLSLTYGLEYFKLDFATVTSAYLFDPEQSGCYATNHPRHRDQQESFGVNFELMWQLFDELHAAKPGLFIDCTFEAMGGLQLIDYAMLQHAEGNWLSNFYGAHEVDLRIRNMAWWRSPAMPATALVIGNPEMQDSSWEQHIKSLAGALPIMLGDPRKLSASHLKKYRFYADWLQQMENKYQFMSFRQDLPGFGEPTEGMWDGFERINTETGTGGIIAVFRQGSKEVKRKITIQYLDPGRKYMLTNMHGKNITSLSGKDFATLGFEWEIESEYDGDLLEITAVNN